MLGRRRGPSLAVGIVAAALLGGGVALAAAADAAAPPESSTAESSAEVVLSAPASVRALLAQHLDLPSSVGGDDAQSVLTRRVQRDAQDLLAPEGYFSPTVAVHRSAGAFTVVVDPGPRTRVERVDIEFAGALADEAAAPRREELRAGWTLKPGEPFRSPAWEAAKAALLSEVGARDYASARLADSRAEIDPTRQSARLTLQVDSGPAYRFGPIGIEGLRRYDESLVRARAPFAVGDPFRRDALLLWQRRLQNTPWFGSVIIEADPALANDDRLPLRVLVTEAPARRVGFGLGYGTNSGARGEINYRDHDLASRAWEFGSTLRLEQKRQTLAVDLALLPDARAYRPAINGRAERSDIQGLVTLRQGVGISRSRIDETRERWHGIDWQREERRPEGAPARADYALVLDWRRIVREVDDLVNPRAGYVFDLRIGGASTQLLSDRDFVRTQLRAQAWWPVGARHSFSLRGEFGQTAAASRVGIPQDYLFRTGGANSVRGHSYQSLGVREGQAVVGGRALLSGSAEYTHWFAGETEGGSHWGVALFADAGDAADRWADLNAATGAGFGLRWRSPAGPLAFDLARGSTTSRWHPHFSLLVAF